MPGVRWRGGVPGDASRARRGTRARHRRSTPERPGDPALVVHGGHLGRPGYGADRATLFREADAALAFGKKHGRTCVSAFDAERHAAPGTERSEAGRAQLVAQVAASGALKTVFQPIYDLRSVNRAATKRSADRCPVRDSPTRPSCSPRPRRRADRGAGPGMPHDVDRRVRAARAARQPDPQPLAAFAGVRPFSVHGLVKLLQRHGVDPARVVLELTERESVEDMDRLIRAPSIRVGPPGCGWLPTTSEPGMPGLRLLSQIRFDIVKIDLSLIHGGAVRATSHEVVQTLKDLADRWGALVIAEGIETAEQLEFVRSLGIRAGQGYLLGMPAEQPTGEPVDLDALVRSDTLGLGVGLRSSRPFGMPGT